MTEPGDFVMPVGKYKGKTLDEIAESDEGLLYLDWIRGEFDPGATFKAISAYLQTGDTDDQADANAD